jgi:hypothetical protein
MRQEVCGRTSACCLGHDVDRSRAERLAEQAAQLTKSLHGPRG